MNENIIPTYYGDIRNYMARPLTRKQENREKKKFLKMINKKNGKRKR